MMISQQTFCGKTAEQLRLESPVFCAVEALRETTWLNDKKLPFAEAAAQCPLSMEDVLGAEARLKRFADYFRIAFPETAATGGLIESFPA